MQIEIGTAIHFGTNIVAVSSVAHTLLPPWEAFNEFPRMQKYYKLFIYFVACAALNGRSLIYKSISTDNGSHPSQAANGGH